LVRCIEAVRASAEHAGATVEVVLVDNGSIDESAGRRRASGADVVVYNPLNAGYGVAAAQGIARARAPWILLLNPDVVVALDFVAAVLAVASSLPASVATIVPDVRFASDPSIVNCRGLQVDDAGLPAEVDSGRPAEPVAQPRPVFGGSSGACVLRAEALRAVGGVEIAFFAYLEDVDLAWRLQRAGYTALLEPRAIAYHEGSASLGEGSPLKAFLVARNRRILFRLNGPHSLRVRLWRTVTDLGHAAVTSSQGAGPAPWCGRLDALRLRPYTRFVRRSRGLVDRFATVPELVPRATWGATLKRKRAISQKMRRSA
jgi:GT2 family glycosyltransferase